MVFKILVVTYGDQMQASDWPRGKGRFLTPVGVYKDVLLWIWMYIYIRNPDPSLFWSNRSYMNQILPSYYAKCWLLIGREEKDGS